MIRALVGKELRQHAITFFFAGALLLGGLALISSNGAMKRSGGGGFEALRFVHYSFVPLACIMLGQVLIATEFRQKTQLFLEGLPLPRWRMLAVKFTLGFVLISLAVVATFVAVWWPARGTAALTPRFAALIAAKSAGWVWFIYSLCFVHSFLGRYRVVFGTVLVVGLIYAMSAGVRLADFGPFGLVDDRFAYERHVVPTAALVVAFGSGLLLAALGFALGLVRDATVAALLAERMSAREKVVATFVALTSLMTLAYAEEHRKTSTPVRLPGAYEVQRGVVIVQASAAVDAPTAEENAALEKLAPFIADELAALVDYLGCKSFPPVFLVHRRDLESNDFTDGLLKFDQGQLVRFNATADLNRLKLLRWLVYRAVHVHTSGFAGRERNAWALDGLAAWWPIRDHDKLEKSARLERALETMPPDFSAQTLRTWFRVREKSELRAEAFASTGMSVLRARHGDAACRKFLSSMFSRSLRLNARGWFADVVPSSPAKLRAATGVSEEEFVREWRAALEAAR